MLKTLQVWKKSLKYYKFTFICLSQHSIKSVFSSFKIDNWILKEILE